MRVGGGAGADETSRACNSRLHATPPTMLCRRGPNLVHDTACTTTHHLPATTTHLGQVLDHRPEALRHAQQARGDQRAQAELLLGVALLGPALRPAGRHGTREWGGAGTVGNLARLEELWRFTARAGGQASHAPCKQAGMRACRRLSSPGSHAGRAALTFRLRPS